MAKISTYPHERRWQHVLLKDMSDIAWSSAIAPTLIVDGIVTMTAPCPFWAHLADELCGRQVLLEHFSRSMSPERFHNALAKLTCFSSFHLKRRDRSKTPPILVIMVHRRPDTVLADSLIASTTVAGIYRSTSELVPFIIIVATELPRDDRRLDAMRLSTRVGDELELAQLLADQQFTNVNAALKLVEDMMRTVENPEERIKKLWAEVQAEANAINEAKMEALRAEMAKKDAAQAAEIAKMREEIERLRRALDEHTK